MPWKFSCDATDDGKVAYRTDAEAPVAQHAVGRILLQIATRILCSPDEMVPTVAMREAQARAEEVTKEHPAKWITAKDDDTPIALCKDCKEVYGASFRPAVRLPAGSPKQPCSLCLDPQWIPKGTPAPEA